MRWLWVVGLMMGCSNVNANISTFCELEVSCSPDDWDGVDSCIDLQDALVDAATGECEDAVKAVLRCRATLDTCEALADYWEEPTVDYPCAAQDADAEAACFSDE